MKQIRYESVWYKRSSLEKVATAYRERGATRCFKEAFDYFYRQILYLTYPLYKSFLPNNRKTFVFNQKEYKYCLDKFNLAWKNERTLEIPIFKEIVQQHFGKKVLEVGCVLRHYYKLKKYSWTTIDKYERFPGVLNKDILKYFPKKKFDLIFSISTFEHIGLEDETSDDKAAIKAIRHLQKYCLKSKGKLFITIPIGYNPYLDEAIIKNKIKFDREYYFARTANNQWFKISKAKAYKIKYGHPYFAANSLFIGIINK